MGHGLKQYRVLSAFLAGIVLGLLLFTITFACWLGLKSWVFASPWVDYIVFPAIAILSFAGAGWLVGARSRRSSIWSAALVGAPTLFGFLLHSADWGVPVSQWAMANGALGAGAFLLFWGGITLARRWAGLRDRIPWRAVGICLGCIATAFVVNTAFWLGSARSSLVSQAWPALVIEHVHLAPAGYLPKCIAIDPVLYSATAVELRETVRDELMGLGIELRVAPPTHGGGYADRECVEYCAVPQLAEMWAFNLPGVGTAAIAYNTYDSNGDAVLMMQLGPKWIYLRSWNAWY